jgi:hypothetical protein
MGKDKNIGMIEKILNEKVSIKERGNTSKNSRIVKEYTNNIKEWREAGYTIKDIFYSFQIAGIINKEYTYNNFFRVYARINKKDKEKYDTQKTVDVS